MDKSPIEEIQTSLKEKRANLANWLETTPTPEKETVLGPATETEVQTHMEVMDKTLQKASENTLGVCTVCHGEIESRLLEMDYTTSVCLEDMSEEESRHLEAELELAQTVQQSLMPQEVPDTHLLEFAAFSRPAQIVGGDYFDFFHFQDGTDGMAIADVAGHGISASLYMAGLQALLRSLTPTSVSPAEVVGHIHRLLVHNVRFSTFVTLFLASFDPDTHVLTFCNAGHNPPLVFHEGSHPDRKVDLLMPTSSAVGIVEESTFQEHKIQLEPGDTIVMYTDGVSEASNADGDQFGQAGLAKITEDSGGSTAKELIQKIRQGLAEFIGKQSPADDMTIVACRVIA